MDINKEVAILLWNKHFGRATTVKDFTDRVIVKGAYNDRNSKFGWNLDHILPQSRGGKNSEHNLIICHILTNDEKADKSPAFKANNINYEIIKVENHYEIREVKKSKTVSANKIDVDVNFMDSASGIRFFKKLKGIQSKTRFVCTVNVRLKNLYNNAVIDFIESIFDEENIFYLNKNIFFDENKKFIVAKNYDMPLKEDMNKLLDKCILLNTYLKNYFIPMKYVAGYDIYYEIEHFDSKENLYANSLNYISNNEHYSNKNKLFINKLVYINTEAQEREPELKFYINSYEAYDYTYTKLSKNLQREVNEK